MNFNKHYHLEGLHAFLGASKHHWVNYSEDKLDEVYTNHMAAARGTRLHEFANEAILLGIKLPRSQKTLNMFVNDAIGYRMESELILRYSDNCFGTVDAISFKSNLLRIHDLKTGVTPTSMRQLEIYAAYFCLEYNIDPSDITMELRIYQNDTITIHIPDAEDIQYIMNKAVEFDKRIEFIKNKGY